MTGAKKEAARPRAAQIDVSPPAQANGLGGQVNITSNAPNRQGSWRRLDERSLREYIVREAETEKRRVLEIAANEETIRPQVAVHMRDLAETYRLDAEAERAEIAWLDMQEQLLKWWRHNLRWNFQMFAELDRTRPQRLAKQAAKERA